jgi:DNA-binding MarR family transcriptional regulator
VAGTDSIERLVRELYGLAAIKRDTARRALPASAIAGLSALATLERLGPSRVGAVADALHVDLSVASRQIAALTAAGHVRRERDAADGRSQLIAITGAGQAALTAAHGRMVETFADAVRGWSDDDVAGLAASLTRLREDYAAAMTP